MKILTGIEGNPLSYFNYLVLCWEGGIYTDEFVFKELDRVALNPYTGRSFSSYLFGMIYEAQNNFRIYILGLELTLNFFSHCSTSFLRSLT